VIFIYKELAKKYINRLSINDVKNFADKNKIEYTNEELVIVYNFIMYNYNDLLDGNIKIIDNIKDKISPTLYKRLINLYIEYRQKYL